MNAISSVSGISLAERSKRVAAVAEKYADAVDKEGRFPIEAVDAMKAEQLLSIQISVMLGGEGASILEICELCNIIGQACSSSAMIFAMHHIKLSSLVSHGEDDPWHAEFMRRICREQLLLGSATTEAGIGGNLRNSICAIEIDGDMCRLNKDATVISYGTYADAILITSRAHRDAAPSDQVMTVFLKDQYTLERTHVWDTMGMRGTCSDGFLFKGVAPKEQILPKPFAEIAAQSMLATCHLFWGSLWYGIALNAVARAQAFVRAAARSNPSQTPLGALHLAEASGQLQMIKATVVNGVHAFEEARKDNEKLSSMAFAVAMNNVKTATSQAILPVINLAMQVCGIMGYKNGTPYSVGRHLRDANSAQLMISNDRILSNTSNLLLVQKQDNSLLG